MISKVMGGKIMLLGILKKGKGYFVAKTLGGQLIKTNDFELDSGIGEGQVIELDINDLNYETIDREGIAADE